MGILFASVCTYGEREGGSEEEDSPVVRILDLRGFGVVSNDSLEAPKFRCQGFGVSDILI